MPTNSFKRLFWLLLRSLLRLIRDIDGFFTYIAYRFLPKKYALDGGCLQRGVCCKNIAVYLSKSYWENEKLMRLAQWWYEFVYNFELRFIEEDSRVLIFKCRYLTPENRCGIYWRRPYICRNYPNFGFFEKPVFLPGCGFSIKPPKKDVDKPKTH
ncbi:MAG: YkgJ family cysteine cluster protein [Candidatus Margulisiibacteriota bacterium]